MRIILDSNAEPIAFRLRKISENVMPAFNRNMKIAIAELERVLKINMSGVIIHRRTGNLIKSVRHSITSTKDLVVGMVGIIKTPYAKVLEEGKTIHKKKAKWLWIPASGFGPASSARPGGQTSMTPSEAVSLFRPKHLPRGMPYTFVKKIRSDLAICYYSNGKGKLKKLFILKPSVKIDPFRYMEKTRQQVAQVIPVILERSLINAS